MENAQYDRGQLAALAVFRDLYDSKTDLFEVLSMFLKEIILKRGLYSFSTNQINTLLKSTYEFEIPDAVIHTALGKIPTLSKSQGTWNLPNMLTHDESIENKQEEILKTHDCIKDQLIEFVQKDIGRALLAIETDEMLASFSSFLLEERADDKYIAHITAFIIANESTPGFRATLNQIREGVVLYVGLKYNNNVNDKGSWNSKLTIFLETEILFHFAGYNGEVCKQWFMDMYRFIQEANTKSKDQIIFLRYLPKVREEFEHFFHAAEMIIAGDQINDPSKTAMQTILNGCKTASDVIEKKAKFYETLTGYRIKEEFVNDIDDEGNYKLWIYNQGTIERLQEKFGKSVEECLSCLNKIAILRKGSVPRTLEDARYILVSGKTLTTQIARDEEIKPNGTVPLAISVNNLTSRLWFKLNRGFGKDQFPKSFDVIARAQMSLAAKIGDALHGKFNEYKQKFTSNKITKEAAALIIIW